MTRLLKVIIRLEESTFGHAKKNDVPEINKLKHHSTASPPAMKDGKTHSSSKLMHPFLTLMLLVANFANLK